MSIREEEAKKVNDRIYDSFMELVDCMHSLEELGGFGTIVRKLDSILGRLENLSRELVFVEKESNTNDKFNVGDKVMADGLICEIVDAGEDEDGTMWYDVTPVTGYAHGFVRSFTADKLLKVQ